MQTSEPISDEALVVEVRAGKKERYADVVKRYQEKLMRYATYLLHDEQKALDVVQDSFIKAYMNLNGFDEKKKFSSWIYRIVHNEAINSVRKYQKETPLIVDADIQSDEDIEDEYMKKEIVEKARLCLGKMPVTYREPIALYYLEEKSYEEISDILRIPMGTVAIRISRGKSLMKTLCQRHT